MPAYNAALTLERTYADIPHPLVERIILVDDVSHDQTVEIARRLGLDVIIHHQNLGYGGNQKTCYDAALAAGAQVVVMLHPDYQYDATRIPALIEPILGAQTGRPSRCCRREVVWLPRGDPGAMGPISIVLAARPNVLRRRVDRLSGREGGRVVPLLCRGGSTPARPTTRPRRPS